MSKIITSVQMAKAIDYSHEYILQTIEDAMATADRESYLTPYGKGYMYSLPQGVFHKLATEEFGTITRYLLLKAWQTSNSEETTWITLEAAEQLFSEIPREWALIEKALISENVEGRKECVYSPITDKVSIVRTYERNALLEIATNIINSGV